MCVNKAAILMRYLSNLYLNSFPPFFGDDDEPNSNDYFKCSLTSLRTPISKFYVAHTQLNDDSKWNSTYFVF